ncbi:MAG: hypothetical protein RL701_4585 [Pseudomonadota bacterium]
MQVFHTEGAPPSVGNSTLPTNGSNANSVADAKPTEQAATSSKRRCCVLALVTAVAPWGRASRRLESAEVDSVMETWCQGRGPPLVGCEIAAIKMAFSKTVDRRAWSPKCHRQQAERARVYWIRAEAHSRT